LQWAQGQAANSDLNSS